MITLKAQYSFICGHVHEEEPIRAPGAEQYIPYGGCFTPKGTLRTLVVFVQFTNDAGQNLDGWPAGQEVPNYVHPVTGIMPELIFSNANDFTTYPEHKSISNYYKVMSNGTFNFFGDVLKKNGRPYSIKVNPDGLTRSWSSITKKVLEQIDSEITNGSLNITFSAYDLHKNRPNYQVDASLTGPDNKIDYLTIIYRYNSGWSIQPINELNKDIMSHGGEASLGLSYTFNNGYIAQDGYRQTAGAGNATTTRSVMLHEIAHKLYSAPHYMGANGACGSYFEFPASGWGMINGKINICANAWERWILGWIELTTGGGRGWPVNSDIQSKVDLQNDGIYTIRDFITTNDVIRIKLPHLDNCYLWIENHQNISPFDNKEDAGKRIGIDEEKIPEISTGLYMFIENNMGTRSTVPSGTNKIHTLNAQGNYDYWHPSVPPEPSWNHYYNNILYPFKRLQKNPVSGLSPYYAIHDDYPTNPLDPTDTNDTIKYTTNSNGGSREAFEIIRETDGNINVMTYASRGGVNDEARLHLNRRSDAFLTGDEIGLSGIVPVLAPPTYSGDNCKTGSYILNGISVKVLSQNPLDKSLTIQIKMDDYTVRYDKRWCGYIDLVKKSPEEEDPILDPGSIYQRFVPDLELASNVQLTLDKTGTANRHLKHPYFGDFFNPTVLTIKEGAYFAMRSNSTLVVKNNSTLVIENGATLYMDAGAKILVKKGSNLVIRSGAKINIQNKARIDIEEDAYICLAEGADLHIAETGSLNMVCNVNIGVHPGCDVVAGLAVLNILNYPYTGTGRITKCAPPVIHYVQNETFTGYNYLPKYKIIAGNIVTASKLPGPVKVSAGSTVVFKTIDCVEIRDDFEVELGAEFIIEPANEED